jgi:hypothetical protein
MKLDIRVIGDFGIKKPFALRQVHHVAVFIFRDIGLFKPGEILQFGGVVAG